MTYKPSVDSNLIDSTGVAEILGISRNRVYQLSAKGSLPKPVQEKSNDYNYTHRLWARDEIIRFKEQRIPIPPEEFARRMREFANRKEGSYEQEVAGHEEADALMCEILRTLGYGNGVDIFKSMQKWYM